MESCINIERRKKNSFVSLNTSYKITRLNYFKEHRCSIKLTLKSFGTWCVTNTLQLLHLLFSYRHILKDGMSQEKTYCSSRSRDVMDNEKESFENFTNSFDLRCSASYNGKGNLYCVKKDLSRGPNYLLTKVCIFVSV